MHPYIERILNTLGNHDPIEVLSTTPGQLERILELCSEANLERSYASGKWSTRQILAHLADTEILMAYRLRQALADPAHVVQPVDENLWAKRYSSLGAVLAVQSFVGLRSWNLAFIRSFDLQDWLTEVEHPERGPESVDLMVRFMAGHDLNHLAQLERILELGT